MRFSYWLWDTGSTLHRMFDGWWEFPQPVGMCFVGFLWEVLQEYGARGPLLTAVLSLYNRSSPLSPVLFIIL